MTTNIDYRRTVTSADEFTRAICQDILDTPDTLPEAREYAEYILTLPIKADGKSAGFASEPEARVSRTGNGTASHAPKASNPADLISATDRQLAALVNMGSKKLIGDASIRHLTADIRIQDVVDRAAAGTIVTKGEASKALDFLFAAPWKPREAVAPKPAPAAQSARKAPVTEDGMYRLGDRIVKVQKAVHGSGKLYAKELIGHDYDDEEGGTQTEWKFEYAPGLINKLTAADRMTLDEAKAFGTLYGVCCVCSATLTDEKSISRGIGPKCGGRI